MQQVLGNFWSSVLHMHKVPATKKRGNVFLPVSLCALMEVMSYSVSSHLLKFGGGSGDVVEESKKSNVHLKLVCELCMNRQE